MLIFLKNRLIEKGSSAFQNLFVSLAFVYAFGCVLGHDMAFAQAPQAVPPQMAQKMPQNPVMQAPMQMPMQTIAQTNAQMPMQTIAQTNMPPMQNGQSPINMTVSTTINTPQTFSQSQSMNVPPQNQIQSHRQNQATPQAITQQQYASPKPVQHVYGLTPNTPSLERNLYLNSVWSTLVPRRQLYEDPARKIHPSRVARNVPKKKMNMKKKSDSTAMASMKKDDRIKLKSGSHVVIQPGENVTVWADLPADTPGDTPANTPGEKNKDNMTNSEGKNNEMNTPFVPSMNSSEMNTPFVPSGIQSSEIPRVQVPSPTVPSANLSVEPRFGTSGV